MLVHQRVVSYPWLEILCFLGFQRWPLCRDISRNLGFPHKRADLATICGNTPIPIISVPKNQFHVKQIETEYSAMLVYSANQHLGNHHNLW